MLSYKYCALLGVVYCIGDSVSLVSFVSHCFAFCMSLLFTAGAEVAYRFYCSNYIIEGSVLIMKLEVGRVYVMLDSDGAFKSPFTEKKPVLVKVTKLPDLGYVYVLGLEPYDGLPLEQGIPVCGLKPASEKQRVIFNREYNKVVHNFKEKGRRLYWL